MITLMFNTISNKKIALFGFAFKANTGDTRESPAIYVARHLINEQAKLTITDPKAIGNAKEELKPYLKDGLSSVQFTEDPYEAAKDSHAIAILTEWDEYRDLDYKKIFESMEKPAFIFDGRDILDHEKLFKLGFNVSSIGKPLMTHF
jgi:UDPglucose 6-dehydrogenase